MKMSRALTKSAFCVFEKKIQAQSSACTAKQADNCLWFFFAVKIAESVIFYIQNLAFV